LERAGLAADASGFFGVVWASAASNSGTVLKALTAAAMVEKVNVIWIMVLS
jgi:hypothetical protein